MRPVFFDKPWQPRPCPRWRWLINVWMPVAIALAIIAIESTSTFSAKNTSGWLRPLAQAVFGAIPDSVWDPFHHYLRKTGHFVGYGAVAFTFLRAWLHTIIERGPRSPISWRLESCILAVFSTAIVATCDEAHQTILPDRTGSPYDVLLDTTGAFALCLLVWLICWSRRPPQYEQ